MSVNTTEQPERTQLSAAKAIRAVVWFSVVAAIAVYLFSGIYVVKPEQNALVLRCGKQLPRAIPPGTHYHLPWPIDRVYYFEPNTVKNIVISQPAIFSEAEIEGEVIEEEAEGEQYDGGRVMGAEFLTGDENIIHIALDVQYRIGDPSQFVFGTTSPEKLVKAAAEMALAATAAHTPVDDLLTSGKRFVLARVKEACQNQLHFLEAGIEVIGVNFASVFPPAEVSDAFKDVASALEDKDRIINEAVGDQNEALYRARGNAQKQMSEAEGYRESKVNRAKGETDRFLTVLTEYRESGESVVTLNRLHIEAMEEVLSRVKKYLIDPPK